MTHISTFFSALIYTATTIITKAITTRATSNITTITASWLTSILVSPNDSLGCVCARRSRQYRYGASFKFNRQRNDDGWHKAGGHRRTGELRVACWQLAKHSRTTSRGVSDGAGHLGVKALQLGGTYIAMRTVLLLWHGKRLSSAKKISEKKPPKVDISLSIRRVQGSLWRSQLWLADF